MASLKVVRGRLNAFSEAEVKQKIASWGWWRIIDESGKDVMIKNVRALEFMRSHVVQDEEGIFVFTNDGAPWFIAFKYGHDGHIADGWQEWKDRRDSFLYMLISGVAMVVPATLHQKMGWSQDVGYWLFFLAILGLLFSALGAFGCLGNLLSRRPSKAQVAAALNGET
jgi:hypothetical protein